MEKKITKLAAIGLFSMGSLAFANTQLLENPDFSNGTEGWMAGSNVFSGGDWQAYVTDAYTVDDRVDPEGDGFVFTSWDDETSDRIETYLLQEFGAGPVGSGTESIFETGDVIVFKGAASATREGNDTSDMTVRAFIKVLGYNELGWAFQIKDEYSAFHTIGPDLEPFNLSVTFPDLDVDDSLQVLQLGFEISTEYDGAAMDSGSIYFENLEGYIEGEGGTTWAGYDVDENGWANTGDWMGWVNVTYAPWVSVVNIDNYIYVEESGVTDSGAWMYILGK